ncbi:hypothetical protein RHMOL_Rhmol02G0311800 [Rhododendron molle]|uniref:Uncharacterized protein n=1 Tax=Rhododendron molle TaxID=49168 RepID=A0ACC0PY15_RHOML|nr:hypothetical protein RHMOL_Rhmol02G0311800 [Rhododendron molle]
MDFNNVASLCHGYTGSDLLELCKQAARFLQEEKNGKKPIELGTVGASASSTGPLLFLAAIFLREVGEVDLTTSDSCSLSSILDSCSVSSIFTDMVARDAVNPDHLDAEFESTGGLDSIKQALFELVILPLRRPRLFARGKLLGPPKGVLLYGPPGTGKTMLAKAIAKEPGAVFINVRVSHLMSKWFGDSQKLVSAVFSLAYKLQPAIIFIDEVDNEVLTNMRTEFMALWDGFTTDKNARVMVLAATNHPTDLDEAILRRLPQAFEIGKPDCGDREKILKVILKGERIDDNIDFNHVANLCQGYTGSDLLELCKQAAYIPLRDFLQEEKNGKQPYSPRPLSQLDLEKAWQHQGSLSSSTLEMSGNSLR